MQGRSYDLVPERSAKEMNIRFRRHDLNKGAGSGQAIEHIGARRSRVVFACNDEVQKGRKTKPETHKLLPPQRQRWAFFLPTTTAVIVSAKAERRVHAHNKAGESHQQLECPSAARPGGHLRVLWLNDQIPYFNF